MIPLISEAIEIYVKAHTTPVTPLLEELERETYAKMEYPEMLTGTVEGRLLQILIIISGSRNVVEIGTFTGYSALMMAEGLPQDGRLITCEISNECARIAQSYFDRSPHGSKIHLKLGPARNSLEKIPVGSIDFVFIDADKIAYPLYYRESIRILKKGGLIVADNALWSGKVLNPEDEDGRAIEYFNEIVNNDERVEKTLLTVRDGIYLIRKK
jgi:caffeoyl-CoA O-methyltransferase